MMAGVMTAGCVMVFMVHFPFFRHDSVGKTKTPLPGGEFPLSERLGNEKLYHLQIAAKVVVEAQFSDIHQASEVLVIQSIQDHA